MKVTSDLFAVHCRSSIVLFCKPPPPPLSLPWLMQSQRTFLEGMIFCHYGEMIKIAEFTNWNENVRQTDRQIFKDG